MSANRQFPMCKKTLSEDLTIFGNDDYHFLDSGDGCRLEQFGRYRLIRSCPAAYWPREQPELWKQADAVHERGQAGEGRWKVLRSFPSQWMINWQGLRLKIKPTAFGHLGFFPEHATHWQWMTELLNAIPRERPAHILHLFAYTGSMTLAAARAGARLCHVDAVADTIAWARQNAAASGLDKRPIRWIKDDVMKFTAREIRRGRRYEGIILDPPSYGKGPAGERWILEKHLWPLLERLAHLLSDRPAFILFTCHSNGFSPALMRNLLADFDNAAGGHLQSGTMLLGADPLRRQLPCGYYVRWTPAKSAITTA